MPKQLNDEALHVKLLELTKQEKKITADVIEHIAEVDRRRLYIKYEFTSLYQYLTNLGYPPASAQRRIDAARLQNQVPALSENLRSGEINLSQVSILSQALRRTNRVGAAKKSEILKAIQGKDLKATEILVNQVLNIAAQTFDKKHFQKDESVRVEMTLSKSQWDLLEKVKQRLSHVDPNPSLATIFEKLAHEFLNKTDPRRTSTSDRKSQVAARTKGVRDFDRRKILQDQPTCQWKHPKSQQKCDSQFQLQVDHIHPRWAGGGNQLENLQVLCAIHNRLKYELESH